MTKFLDPINILAEVPYERRNIPIDFMEMDESGRLKVRIFRYRSSDVTTAWTAEPSLAFEYKRRIDGRIRNLGAGDSELSGNIEYSAGWHIPNQKILVLGRTENQGLSDDKVKNQSGDAVSFERKTIIRAVHHLHFVRDGLFKTIDSCGRKIAVFSTGSIAGEVLYDGAWRQVALGGGADDSLISDYYCSRWGMFEFGFRHADFEWMSPDVNPGGELEVCDYLYGTPFLKHGTVVHPGTQERDPRLVWDL